MGKAAGHVSVSLEPRPGHQQKPLQGSTPGSASVKEWISVNQAFQDRHSTCFSLKVIFTGHGTILSSLESYNFPLSQFCFQGQIYIIGNKLVTIIILTEISSLHRKSRFSI